MELEKPWEIRMPWETFDPARAKEISGSEGVYELADDERALIYVHYSGGREPFGFRGCMTRHFTDEELNPVIRARARFFRYEVCFSYLSRWKEILGRYFEEHGTLPEGNLAADGELPGLPRFTGGHRYRWGSRWGELPEKHRRGHGEVAD
jgi:hypothetical protein